MSTELEQEIQYYLEKLVTEFGVRPTGSAAERSAERYIEDVFSQAGLMIKKTGIPLPGLGRHGMFSFDG